ncbi:MAG: type II toxin-antitoxin system RelE/ParE family toxin [Candidatus Contendobacter sp.]
MAEVRWAETALADLAAIRDYLSQHSSAAGRRFVQECFNSAETLALFPRRGRRVREAHREEIRELIVQGHRLIYWTDGERVTLLAVIHGRRDFERINPKPWE